MSMTTQDITRNYTAPFDHMMSLYAEKFQNSNNDRGAAWFNMALAAFNEQSFPTRRDENWKYTSVARILNMSYATATDTKVSPEKIENCQPNNLDSYRIVFVNGLFKEELSDFNNTEQGVHIFPLSELPDSGKLYEQVNAHFNSLDKENNAFTSLNAASTNEAICIQIERNAQINKVIHIIHLSTDTEKPFVNNPLCFVYAETGAQATLLESYHNSASETSYFTNAVNRIHLDDNSRIVHLRVQNEGKHAFQVSNTSVWQRKDSTYSGYQIDLGGRLIRNNLNVNLMHSGTHTDMYGIYLAKNEQHIDNQSFIDHAFPHCTSNELYKGIISDKGTGVFNGKIIVRQDAQKTNAFQQNSSLVLSPNASMNAKPQLEIFADDVRCSHGATIGQLDESALFYLRSRGLNPAEARSILQFAFVMEVLENVVSPEIYAFIENLIHDAFRQ